MAALILRWRRHSCLSKAVGLYFPINRLISCNIHADTHMKHALTNYRDVVLVPYRIGSCLFGQNFTDAQLHVMQYLKDKNDKVIRPLYVRLDDRKRGAVYTHGVKFSSAFQDGFDALEKQVFGKSSHETGESNFPKEDPHCAHAINALSSFLRNKDVHEEALEVFFYGAADFEFENRNGGNLQKLSKEDDTILLANHVFSQLAAGNTNNNGGSENYVISKDITKYKRSHCPCANNCGEVIKYGNTEFGSEYFWYGQADIMVFPVGGGACNIILPSHGKCSFFKDFPKDIRSQYMELNSDTSVLRSHRNVQQIVSQAVTFSFLQSKFQNFKNLPSTTLVPTIAAYRNAFDIYLYDFENDILLRNMGDPIPLFQGYEFNIPAIIQLWMLINHTSCSTNLDENALRKLRNTCGLQQIINRIDGNSLEIILDSIRMGTIRKQNDETIYPVVNDFDFNVDIIGS